MYSVKKNPSDHFNLANNIYNNNIVQPTSLMGYFICILDRKIPFFSFASNFIHEVLET